MRNAFRMSNVCRFAARFIVLGCFAAVLPTAGWAQIAPSLGAATSFAVLGASTVTNTGPSVINGDLGVKPGTAITGFPPGLVVGATHSADAVALSAQSAVTNAYVDLAGQPCQGIHTGSGQVELGGL